MVWTPISNFERIFTKIHLECKRFCMQFYAGIVVKSETFLKKSNFVTYTSEIDNPWPEMESPTLGEVSETISF